MKACGVLWLRFLRGSRATYGRSAAALLDGFLEQRGEAHAANLPPSQKFFYARDVSQKHQAVQLRLGSAQMLSPTSSNINNLNEAHPLFFSQTAPRGAGLCVSLVLSLKKLGITRLTELQGALIPLFLKGKHVIAHAETGTGKSFGIALACANRIVRENINYRLHTVIIVPTQELALQYDKWLRHFCGSTQQVVQVAIESISLEVQLAKLHNIQPHVLVGTPQRIADVMRFSPTLLGEKLRRKVDCVILDEADIVLFTEVKFGRQTVDGITLVDRLFRSQREEVPAQIVAASATIDGRTAQALNTWMRNDKAVRLTTSFVEHTIPPTISFYFFAQSRQYSLTRSLELVLRLICKQQTKPRVLLFTSPETVKDVSNHLSALSETAPEIIKWLQRDSSREIAAPLETLVDTNNSKPRRIYRGRHDVYVKDNSSIEKLNTDSLLVGVGSYNLSRGIHISGVSHVIIFGECPPPSLFVHCAGRTGRMGMEGHVVLLYPPQSGRAVQQMCDAVEIPFLPGRMEDVEGLLVDSDFSSAQPSEEVENVGFNVAKQ
ncbi:unnamed protein product [Trypanosoma congolense IL3000]|uniref:WGS project CAEQ00000000 data, annotated contig 1590 n=1 Tax=Trypanosoma congolense (strain IL3000) TaxID=1068625 RepID=F9W7A0_TRYCI|nr:unnamed protein product [Trypanosoma congolense IL3000]